MTIEKMLQSLQAMALNTADPIAKSARSIAKK
jgi:hypothetical protein